MSERRFDELGEALLSAGVAARHVRRAVAELRGHCEELASAARQRGESPAQACATAHRLLGTDACLIERFASRPELRAWAGRRPRLVFTLLPLLALVALLVLAVSAGPYLALALAGTGATPATANRLAAVVRGGVLWGAPLLVAASFAALAYRQRMALRWPACAVAIVGAVAALCQFQLQFVGGGAHLSGSVGVGFGVSADLLVPQLLRAVATLLVGLVPMWLARRALARRRRRVDG